MQNKIYTVVGATGSGKTPFIIGGDFEEGLAAIFKRKGMSTLIIDEVDHPKYRHIPFLLPKDYSKLSTAPGIYRTLSTFQNFRTLLEKIAFEKLVWNTLLVLEDSSKYWNQNFGAMEKTLIGNSKQQNVDIVFMYWAWGQIPPKLFDMTKYFIVFKTSDGPENRKTLLTGCFDDCLQAHQLVCANKKPYCIVETGI